jgi:phage-related minor tail protein
LAGIQSQLGIAPATVSLGGTSFDFASLAAGISVGGLGTLMADGGVVTRATTITAGEAGPEAIIPLDRMKDFGMGGNNVTINVNGGDPNAVVAALRTYMRQNGSVPIKTNNAF